MILAENLGSGFLNDSKALSRTGAHIFLSENVITLPLNDAVLIIAQIIKSVMTSDAEAELAALCITLQNHGSSPEHPCRNEMATVKIYHPNVQINCCRFHKQDLHQ